MHYFGGKAKIAKPLAAFLNGQLKEGQPFVDAFCGSCNVVSKIDDNRVRIANDLHFELMELHKAVQNGQILPQEISENIYKDMRHDINVRHPAWLRGFAGFGCAFSGDWFRGYARNGNGRDYCMNAKNSLLKKHKTLTDVIFYNGSYLNCPTPQGALIYCDIPYKNTTSYSTGSFDHEEFYKWADARQSEGFDVFVSEYAHNVPGGWEIVWSHESKKGIRNSKKVQVATVEVLMHPAKTA